LIALTVWLGRADLPSLIAKSSAWLAASSNAAATIARSRHMQDRYSNLVMIAAIKLMALPKAMACMDISTDKSLSPCL
jgi:hypothetical protein